MLTAKLQIVCYGGRIDQGPLHNVWEILLQCYLIPKDFAKTLSHSDGQTHTDYNLGPPHTVLLFNKYSFIFPKLVHK